MEVRLKNAPCGYLKLDHKSFLIEANDTFLNEMGYKKQEVVGQHIESFLKPANKMVFHSYFYPNINLFGTVDELYIKLKNGVGEEVPFLMNARQFEEDLDKFVDCILMPMRKRIDYEMELRASKRKIEDAYLKNEQALIELENIYQEIEEKQNDLLQLNKKLKKQANTDQLTGIPNRRLFEIKLAEQVERSQQEEVSFSILMIDIDHFKYVNDRYGHPTGDNVLLNIAQLMQERVPVESIVSRYGGEEFVILLADTNEKDALNLAININQLVEQSKCHPTHPVTVSIGVAIFVEGDSAISIMKKADKALYHSKNNGRNQVNFFN